MTMDMSRFWDVREHGFFRVAVIVPRVHVGNPRANADAHLLELEKVRAEGAQYALCPELGLTGYSNGDLFHSEALISEAFNALEYLVVMTSTWNMIVTAGMPIRIGDKLLNAAVTFGHGRIFVVTPKSYLPNYREFYERRHFAGAHEIKDKFIIFHGEQIPCGTDIILALREYPDVRIHVDICEDLWVPIPPGTLAALHGATILANLSASNITVGKAGYREQLVVGSSGRNNAVQMYAAAGYGEYTTDLAWDGQGLIAERGMLLAKTERFALSGTHIVADVDSRMLVMERTRQNSFRENQADHPADFRIIEVHNGYLGGSAQAAAFEKLERIVISQPFVPNDPDDLSERCYEVMEIQATSLMRRLESMPEGRRKVAVGVSGGQDSTHALLVACHAMDLMGAPRTNITGVTMPGFGTTGRTYENACSLIRATGVVFKEVQIRDLSETMFKSIGYEPDLANPGLAYENIQAWMRVQTLLAITAKDGGMVLGIGDLSELALGWCTYLGDHASHYNPNGVPKTLISHLIRWSADVTFKNESALQAVLRDILDTPISPELLLPDASGRIKQKTEDKNGPYELHDFFLYYFVRFGLTPYRIARLALHAFAGAYTLSEIKKWLKIFVQRFFRNQFKRSCLPDGPKVGLTCLSPRGDWRMPSDAEADVWLKDVERIPDN